MPNDSKQSFTILMGLISRSDAEGSISDDFCATAGGLFYPLHTCGIIKSQGNPEIIAALHEGDTAK